MGEPDDTRVLVERGYDAVADRYERLDAGKSLELVAGAGFEVLGSDVETQFEGDHDVDHLWVLARRG